MGIKVNLELVLLFHEIFSKKNKTIKVKIGSPISHQTFDETKARFEWVQFLQKQVYNLKSTK